MMYDQRSAGVKSDAYTGSVAFSSGRVLTSPNSLHL